MSTFNHDAPNNVAVQAAEDVADKAEHLARYHRCKQKLDTCSRPMIKDWLSRLNDIEREHCRGVLNNLLTVRKAAREKGEAGPVQEKVMKPELELKLKAEDTKGLNARNYHYLAKTNSLHVLNCKSCRNSTEFYDVACFIYCAKCRTEIKY